tara:strand:+ start:5527 stop:6075 length:549 start_codon:yes stop_codon:yes gene_type:complete
MYTIFKNSFQKITLISLIIPFLCSCSSIKTETKRADMEDIIYLPSQQSEREISRRGGNSLIKNLFNNKSNNASEGIKLSINQYLWQASLDIISSTMPLASVDSASGIIISDWYNIKGKQDERIKISILINSQELRADGIKVSIFKQVLRANSWNNANINPKIITKLERKIIQKAGVLANTSN